MTNRIIYLKSSAQRAVAAWGIVTLCTSSVCIASWTYHIDGVVRVIANLAYLCALPGWIPLYVIGFSGVRDHPIGIVCANGIAWGLWISCIWMMLCLRTRMVRRDGLVERAQPDLSRRRFLANATIGTVSIGAVVTPGYATLVEPWSIKVRRYTVPIRDLDPAFEGLKLVQMSDTHLGPRIPASFVKEAIDLVIAQQPDLVLLTGDYVHDGTDEIDEVAELCGALVEHASIGVVGVLGNHDWWGDGPRVSRELSRHGVRMIDNDRVWLDAKTRTLCSSDPGLGALSIVGFGDLTDDHIDTVRAFRGVAEGTPRIVLSHNPDSAELYSLIKAGSARVDLMCSGHTHGGQVKIPFLGTPIVPSRFGSKYAGGLVDGPSFPVHISRGIGMSLLPVRIGVPPEISVITLTRG